MQADNSKPKLKDLIDAVEHHNEITENNFSLDDFVLTFLGNLSVEELKNFDDIDAWLDLDKNDFSELTTKEKLEQLKEFRGTKWAEMASVWIKTGRVPPIVIVSSTGGEEIGDGRGRVNLANVFDLKIPTWQLKEKASETKKVSLKEIIFESTSIAPIMALGFPKIIAQLLVEKFQHKAFLISKWLKEYTLGTRQDEPNWWIYRNRSFSRKMDMAGYVELYEALENPTKLLKLLKEYKLVEDDKESITEEEISNYREGLFNEIEASFFRGIFFNGDLISDIQSGKITDLKPYKNLSFTAAKDKFDKKRLFKDVGSVIKQYENGWRWIDAGARCQLVGNQMKNCGSTGVMSDDPDRKLITLFNSKNQPKVVVTYSPNQNRLSSAEGEASSEPKELYHDYILDLENVLNAKYDYNRDAKSTFLNLKVMFKPFLDSISEIQPKVQKTYKTDRFFKMSFKNGESIYTNGYTGYSVQEVHELFKSQDQYKDLFDFLKFYVFDHYKDLNIKKYDLYSLLNKYKESLSVS